MSLLGGVGLFQMPFYVPSLQQNQVALAGAQLGGCLPPYTSPNNPQMILPLPVFKGMEPCELLRTAVPVSSGECFQHFLWLGKSMDAQVIHIK